MSKAGATAIRQLHEKQIGPLLDALTPDEWNLPSACDGWRVAEVVAHFTSNMRIFVEPESLPEFPDGQMPSAEAMAELMIGDRRTWEPPQLLDEYQRFLDPFLAFLDGVQDEPAASSMVALGDLGNHPTHIFSDMFAFDHYCHLHFDLLAPHGPLDRAAPTPDEHMLQPTIAWMLAGLPAMCREELVVLDRTMRLQLTGPGGGAWLLVGGTEELVSVEPADRISTEAAATATSDAHQFVSWATKRSDWRDACTLEGDSAWGSRVLDAINVI